jgi:hypothetical protein
MVFVAGCQVSHSRARRRLGNSGKLLATPQPFGEGIAVFRYRNPLAKSDCPDPARKFRMEVSRSRFTSVSPQVERGNDRCQLAIRYLLSRHRNLTSSNASRMRSGDWRSSCW